MRALVWTGGSVGGGGGGWSQGGRGGGWMGHSLLGDGPQALGETL